VFIFPFVYIFFLIPNICSVSFSFWLYFFDHFMYLFCIFLYSCLYFSPFSHIFFTCYNRTRCKEFFNSCQ
jgi:hypothetical protein